MTTTTQMPKAPEGFWCCAWWGFGNRDTTQAFRPDTDEGILTSDSEKICQQCNRTYWEERAKAEKGK